MTIIIIIINISSAHIRNKTIDALQYYSINASKHKLLHVGSCVTNALLKVILESIF